jgi:hypothetical protein
MAEPETTEVEHTLNVLMEPHDSFDLVLDMMKDLQNQVLTLRSLGSVHPEVIAYVYAQHATAMISAMKIAKKIRPEFADALAKDFDETVRVRSIPGARQVEQRR